MSEVAAGVTFLCSKDASFVNATDLKVLRSCKSKESVIGYVLDLRNNPGGLLDQAVSVTDIFLNRTFAMTFNKQMTFDPLKIRF